MFSRQWFQSLDSTTSTANCTDVQKTIERDFSLRVTWLGHLSISSPSCLPNAAAFQSNLYGNPSQTKVKLGGAGYSTVSSTMMARRWCKNRGNDILPHWYLGILLQANLC